MRRAEAKVSMPVASATALDMLWDMQRWREIWAPIEQVEVIYQDPCHQEFVMDVERDGAVEQVRTIRYRRTDRIEFFSPQPPPTMTRHIGMWHVSDGADGTTVRAIRRYDLRDSIADPDAYDTNFAARLQRILDEFSTAAGRV